MQFLSISIGAFFFAEIKMHPKILIEYQRTSKRLQSNSNKKYYGTCYIKANILTLLNYTVKNGQDNQFNFLVFCHNFKRKI